MIIFIDILLDLLLLYLIMGLVFSFFFYVKAAKIIDEGVKGTPWHFKVIIFPGVVLFWIILFTKYLKKI